MIVLGIETAGPRGSVALLRDDAEPLEVTFPATGRLGAEMTPAIRRLLKQAGLKGDQVPDLVAVDTGPGSYTGLRIGIAAAKGLAFAWSRPLVGVTVVEALSAEALAVVARAAAGERARAVAAQAPFERILCALDASRGEVYAASYARSENRVSPEGAGALVDSALLAATIQPRTFVVGDAAPGFADSGRGIVAADPDLAWPTATRIARIGRRMQLEGYRQDALGLAPTYYRPNEAEEQRRKRARASSRGA